jgi:hypothetical protein
MLILACVGAIASVPSLSTARPRARARAARMELSRGEGGNAASPSAEQGQQPIIYDFRKREVLEVAKSMQACDEAAAEVAMEKEEESWISNLSKLFRRPSPDNGNAAATLVSVGDDLLTVMDENETLYLSREISLQSTASELVTEFVSEVSGELNEAVNEAARECSEAIGALGRAAQASLVSSVAPQWQSKPKAWVVALASSKAQKAVEKLASTCAATPGHVLAHGKTSAGAGKRIDQAWRRDALRALNALQQAPEQIHLEMKRLRFSKLRGELEVLGLQAAGAEMLTLDDLRVARARRAKELHPDVAQATFPGRRERLVTGLLGKKVARRVRSKLPFPTRHDASSDEAMVELNRAYDALRKAVTAPMYL